MEVSGLSSAANAPKPSAGETAKNNGESSQQAAGTAESKSSVSNESQASLVPPPNPASESGNEPATLPTAEGNTGGQINVTV